LFSQAQASEHFFRQGQALHSTYQVVGRAFGCKSKGEKENDEGGELHVWDVGWISNCLVIEFVG
jgi:hypothetical protein